MSADNSGAAGRRPTEEQAAVVAAAHDLRPGEVLRVVAYAGAGKTTTLRGVGRKVAPRRGLYLAFNTTTAAEGRRSFPPNIDPRTPHSVAYRALSMQQREVGPINAHTVLEALGPTGWSTERISGFHPRAQARYIARFLEVFFQSDALEPGEAEIDETLARTVYVPRGKAAERVQKKDPGALTLAARKRDAVRKLLQKRGMEAVRLFMNWREHGLQISHDGYFKVFSLDEGLIYAAFRRYDYVLLDEAQDQNAVARGCIVRSGKPIIAVGDPLQQIYSWRGAQDALRKLPGRRLYLSQSFRFGKAIAAVAWAVVGHKPGTRPEVPLRGSDVADRVVPGGTQVSTRAVLCRTNAEMLGVGLSAARRGQRVYVVGRIEEIIEEVRSAQALYDGAMQLVRADKLRRFDSWDDLLEEAEEGAASDLKRLIKAVEEGLVQQLPVLERACVATEAEADLVIATVHGAKGREWSSVALAEDFQEPEKLLEKFREAVRAQDTRGAQALLEEWNILYVAVTRAIELLALPEVLFETFGVVGVPFNSSAAPEPAPVSPVQQSLAVRPATMGGHVVSPPRPAPAGTGGGPLAPGQAALPPARFRRHLGS